MSVPAWMSQLFSGGFKDIISTVGDTAKKFITTEADRQAFELALQEAELSRRKLEMEGEQKYFEDRSSARDMYKHDSKLQKIYAMTFLVGYIALTSIMVYLVVAWIGAKKIDIPDWAVALISTIYGAMSSKVNTITDFLFGSSQGSKNKDDLIAAIQSGKDGQISGV